MSFTQWDGYERYDFPETCIILARAFLIYGRSVPRRHYHKTVLRTDETVVGPAFLALTVVGADTATGEYPEYAKHGARRTNGMIGWVVGGWGSRVARRVNIIYKRWVPSATSLKRIHICIRYVRIIIINANRNAGGRCCNTMNNSDSNSRDRHEVFTLSSLQPCARTECVMSSWPVFIIIIRSLVVASSVYFAYN